MRDGHGGAVANAHANVVVHRDLKPTTQRTTTGEARVPRDQYPDLKTALVSFKKLRAEALDAPHLQIREVQAQTDFHVDIMMSLP